MERSRFIQLFVPPPAPPTCLMLNKVSMKLTSSVTLLLQNPPGRLVTSLPFFAYNANSVGVQILFVVLTERPPLRMLLQQILQRTATLRLEIWQTEDGDQRDCLFIFTNQPILMWDATKPEALSSQIALTFWASPIKISATVHLVC